MTTTLRSGIYVIALTTLLSGCFSGLGGRSNTPNYHLLTARATAAPAVARTTPIGIGPVQIAQFLDRPQIVTHGGGGALQLNDSQRWGEPLAQGVQRVLLQNMAVLTGAQTRNFPWRQNLTPDYAVRIDVIDLDKSSNGSALLEASWVLEDLKNARVIKTQQEKLQTIIGAGDNALSEAYSNLLAQLAQHITAQLPPQ